MNGFPVIVRVYVWEEGGGRLWGHSRSSSTLETLFEVENMTYLLTRRKKKDGYT